MSAVEPVPPEAGVAALKAAGAAGAVLEELLAYGAPLLTPDKADEPPPLPLADEPQLAAWTRYGAEAARQGGTFNALASVFPQLRYPIRKGISETDGYRAATRRGEWDGDDTNATGLRLVNPGGISLELRHTIAGRIPILVAPERADFEALVRAFSARNEPVDVPPSMGACLVRGLNDWDRIRTYRREWEATHPFHDWNTEFRALVPQKELYEDRFIILSTGPYSGVPADRAGFDAQEWVPLSLSIRREHEATHYFTLRAAGTMRNNLIDELIADYVGLVRTFGRYREDLALLFFGLEAFPVYREGGRLQNYRGTLSDEAFDIAKRLAHDAVRALAALDARAPARGEIAIASRVLELAGASLGELASGALVERAATRGPAADRMTLQVANDLDGVEEAAESVRTFLKALGVTKKPASDIFVVLDEVLSNSVKYAWSDEAAHAITVDVVTSPRAITLEFIDDGNPFDPLAARDPDVTEKIDDKPIGGLGIYLVKRLTNEQRYERTGRMNRLVIRKDLAQT